MAANSENPQPKRQVAAETMLVAVCILLLLLAAVALSHLHQAADLNSLIVRLIGGAGLPKADAATHAARLGVLDATVVLIGSVASLIYLSKRPCWVWNGALAAWVIACGTSSFLAIQGSHTLLSHPARGDFAGLANMGTLVVHVMIPSIAGLMIVIAAVCLVLLRPASDQAESSIRPQNPTGNRPAS
jgi:hypothetical protein